MKYRAKPHAKSSPVSRFLSQFFGYTEHSRWVPVTDELLDALLASDVGDGPAMTLLLLYRLALTGLVFESENDSSVAVSVWLSELADRRGLTAKQIGNHIRQLSAYELIEVDSQQKGRATLRLVSYPALFARLYARPATIEKLRAIRPQLFSPNGELKREQRPRSESAMDRDSHSEAPGSDSSHPTTDTPLLETFESLMRDGWGYWMPSVEPQADERVLQTIRDASSLDALVALLDVAKDPEAWERERQDLNITAPQPFPRVLAAFAPSLIGRLIRCGVLNETDGTLVAAAA